MAANDKQLDKFKAYLYKFLPLQLHVEHNTAVKTIGDIEELDSIDLLEMMDTFIEKLKLDDEQVARVNIIIKDLYAKNNL